MLGILIEYALYAFAAWAFLTALVLAIEEDREEDRQWNERWSNLPREGDDKC